MSEHDAPDPGVEILARLKRYVGPSLRNGGICTNQAYGGFIFPIRFEVRHAFQNLGAGSGGVAWLIYCERPPRYSSRTFGSCMSSRVLPVRATVPIERM